jgi:CO/xanthine dehydrogenase FAD-binding subunit
MMVEVNFNHRHPESVIALRAIDELKQWSIGPDSVFIGAGVPYSQMEHGELAVALPALAEAARTVGSPQIRAAGTLGGNLGTCSPAGDSLPVLSALNALVHLQSPSGERRVPFSEFMVGPKRSAREANEIITGVTIPLTKGWQGYSKVGTRNAMVISVASACLSLNNGVVSIALGSVGPVIIRCTAAESWFNSLAVTTLSDSVAKEFGARVSEEARPIDDHRSTAQYRRHAVGVLATRLLQRGFAS